MTTSPGSNALEQLAAKTSVLRALHLDPSKTLVLPNAWDAATARRVEAAGFAAIATTSGGVAQSLGYEDHEHAPVDEMLGAAARIARAVTVPVSVDFEGGYGLGPAEIARRLIVAGASGLNLEDSDHAAGQGLISAEAQVERIARLREAAAAEGIPLVINARTDVFVLRLGTPEEQLAEGLRRARLYREAGADCVYPILLADLDAIREFVAAVEVININVRRGGPIDPAQARALGVRRASYATSLFRESITAFDEALADIGGNAAS